MNQEVFNALIVMSQKDLDAKVDKAQEQVKSEEDISKAASKISFGDNYDAKGYYHQLLCEQSKGIFKEVETWYLATDSALKKMAQIEGLEYVGLKWDHKKLKKCA